MSNIQISRIHHPITVLGFGTRVGIWVQGCSLACRGCMSRDTWPSRPQNAVAVAEVLDLFHRGEFGEIDGVTLSGGEPFDQPEPLAELLHGLRVWADARPRPVDLLSYSGHATEWLFSEHGEIVRALDCIITEPYRQEQKSNDPLRGSANQLVIPLTELGEVRYGDLALENYRPQRQQQQVVITADQLWQVGIPSSDTLKPYTETLKDAGINLKGRSWLK